jgi:hypothetical protein
VEATGAVTTVPLLVLVEAVTGAFDGLAACDAADDAEGFCVDVSAAVPLLAPVAVVDVPARACRGPPLLAESSVPAVTLAPWGVGEFGPCPFPDKIACLVASHWPFCFRD